MTHDKFCPLITAPCCPHIPDCTCQCLCDWIKEIRADERDKIADKVNVAIGDNGPLFNQSKITDVTIWWGNLIRDIRNVAARGGEQA